LLRLCQCQVRDTPDRCIYKAEIPIVMGRFEGQSDTSVRISGNIRALDSAAACQGVR
jgi:hypothetical protein